MLVVQRTGWGKSAVYLVATVLLREGWGPRADGAPAPSPGSRAGAGASVIISPLLALMRDQVAAARRAGINAVTINSANAAQWDEIEAQVRAGDVDVLLGICGHPLSTTEKKTYRHEHDQYLSGATAF